MTGKEETEVLRSVSIRATLEKLASLEQAFARQTEQLRAAEKRVRDLEFQGQIEAEALMQDVVRAAFHGYESVAFHVLALLSRSPLPVNVLMPAEVVVIDQFLDDHRVRRSEDDENCGACDCLYCGRARDLIAADVRGRAVRARLTDET